MIRIVASVLVALVALVALLGLSGCAIFGPPGAGDFDVVVVDAGHGGHDPGARPRSGRYEKDLALDTAKRLKRALQWRGFRVVLTRDDDTFIPLGDRVKIAARTPKSIFVSIHYNHAKNRSGMGIETFYQTGRSARLAGNVQKEMMKAYKTKDRGVKQRGFYVLRKNSRPSILVEGGFLSNSSDNSAVQSSRTRQRLADAIARGIANERRGKRP
ncbi:MAG: N-acetylmuramoyl-L-alanine amidase [Chthoniobacterales bacterium]